MLKRFVYWNMILSNKCIGDFMFLVEYQCKINHCLSINAEQFLLSVMYFNHDEKYLLNKLHYSRYNLCSVNDAIVIVLTSYSCHFE